MTITANSSSVGWAWSAYTNKIVYDEYKKACQEWSDEQTMKKSNDFIKNDEFNV